MVSTPAGWAFLHLPFYINANRNESWKTWMLRKSSNQIKSPVDPAESEVTQWLNPRNWNDPRRLSGVISCSRQRSVLSLARPSATKWSRVGTPRWMKHLNCRGRRPRRPLRSGSFLTMTEESGQQKRGRKNPTQHRYHITFLGASQRENGSGCAKSVPCTKTVVCIWETFRLEKLENSCYLIVTKRRYLNSRTSGGLPKAKVNKGNQSDFKSK